MLPEQFLAMHDFANAEKKQHAIGFVKYHDYHWPNNQEKNYEELYNEYLTTLNNK